MEERELLESFWLCSIDGIGKKSIEKLMSAADSVTGISSLTDEQLTACIGQRRAGLIRTANTQESRRRAGIRLERMREKGIRFLPAWHAEFPVRLRNIPDPPVMLFVKGRLPQEEQKQAAVIGARACSAYGAQMARYFSDSLARARVGIVSGMARGIDSIAQEAALDAGQPSIAVLGCGVDICYPPENRSLYQRLEREGGLVSEYLPGTQPQAHLFPPRNRIISGLADLVLVIEAREKSGTLITVDMALEQGREVFAVPGRVQDVCSRGCNRLIANGAGIATGPDILLEVLESPAESSMVSDAPKEQGPCAQRILKVLGTELMGLDEIAARTGIALQLLMQELMYLYMEGIVFSQGGKYCKKK